MRKRTLEGEWCGVRHTPSKKAKKLSFSAKQLRTDLDSAWHTFGAEDGAKRGSSSRSINYKLTVATACHHIGTASKCACVFERWGKT